MPKKVTSSGDALDDDWWVADETVASTDATSAGTHLSHDEPACDAGVNGLKGSSRVQKVNVDRRAGDSDSTCSRPLSPDRAAKRSKAGSSRTAAGVGRSSRLPARTSAADAAEEPSSRPLKHSKTSSGASSHQHSSSCDDDDGSDVVESSETAPAAKKKRRKTITDVLREVGCQPASAEDVLGSVKKHFSGKLSAVEMDALDFLDAASFLDNPAPSTSSASLAKCIRETVPKWRKQLVSASAVPTEPGAPRLLVVCSSAIRAVELVRSLRRVGAKGRESAAASGSVSAATAGAPLAVAKLFGKHMKMSQQVQYLTKARFVAGVGNPGRIEALLKADALSLTNVRWVVLDWNWRDVKQKRMVDIPEVKASLMAFLYGLCSSLLQANDVRLVIY